MADTTNSSGATGEVSYNTDQPKKQTPKKWKQTHKSDARKAQSAGGYPDYFSWKTRSGHIFQLDDTQGGETVTLQHRSGTAIQMAPDGSLHITAHNGQYNIVFGEDRMTVSGAQDVTIKGDASVRVYGDYNVTCQKDYNLTVLGNFNLTAKNHNRHILGNIDTQARNENKKLMGSSAKIARGAIAYVAKGSTTIASHSDQVHIGGAAGVNLAVNEGNITQNIEKGSHYVSTKDGSMNHTVDGQNGNINIRTKQGKYKVTADKGDIGHEASSGNIQSTAPSGGIKHTAKNYSVNATQSADVTAQQTLDLRGGSAASLAAASTYVSGDTSVNVKGGTNVNVDGPSALNLNGGMSTLLSAIGLNIPFDFGQAETETGQSRGVHASNRPAGRSEADNWA
jgi:hypothetical protein